MPSENKTPNIGLNQWAGNEYAKRQDFVEDNFIIDAEIKKAQDKADEAFQSASSGKALIKDAITGVDDSIIVPANPTFQQLADCIEEIEIDPYADKGTLTGTSIQFQEADDGLIALMSIKGKTTVTPADPSQPISPDNPATIVGAGDTDFDVVACGKNLFDGGLELGDFSSKTGDKVTSSTIIRSVNKIKVSPGSSYKISSPNSLIARMVWFFYRADGSFISSDASNQSSIVTIPADCNYVTFRTFAADVNLITIGITNLQFELGSVATPYEPYKSNKLTISGLPLNDLPNGVCDEIVQNTDGSWKHIQRVGKFVFDGSTDEGWVKSSTTSVDRFGIGFARSTPNSYGLCTHFRFIRGSNVSAVVNDCGINNVPTFYVNFSAYDVTTLDQFKTWLASNPITLYYELATPVETPLSTKFYLTSYKGITNVYTTANPQVEFTAIAKSELWSGRKVVIPDAIENTDNSVIIPDNATFEQLAAAIEQIQTGVDTEDATATAAQILAGMTAYVKGVKITGTVPNRGAVTQSLPINGSYVIPAGYHNGSGSVSQSITTKGAATYQPSTSAQKIPAGQYLSGDQTIAATTGTAARGDVRNGKSFNSAAGINLTGNMTEKEAATITPGTTDQVIAAGQFLAGAQTIKGDASLISSRILYPYSIFGVVGSAIAGKRSASGTAKSGTTLINGFNLGDGSGLMCYDLVVSGLTFTPRIIIAFPVTSASNFMTLYAPDAINFSSNAAVDTIITNVVYDKQTGAIGRYGGAMSANSPTFYVNSTGFRIPINGSNMNYYWIAIE